MTKALTVYFSITGITRKTAQYVGMYTESDLFELRPLLPYTAEDLNEENHACRSYREYLDVSSRPPLFRLPPDLELYTTIYVGYPIWYEDVPRVVMTFLEQLPKRGQTIIPFATGEDTKTAESDRQLQETFGQNLHILPIVRLSDNPSAIQKWLKTL